MGKWKKIVLGIGIVILAGVIAWFTFGRDLIMGIIERGMLSQIIQMQFTDRTYPGKRPLDFAPFNAELENLAPTRVAELDVLLENATIPEIQDFLNQNKFSSEELTLYYIARIKKLDDNKLNSVIDLNPEALLIARQLDNERKAGQQRGPLHGIPVQLKDIIGTGDQMRNTAGAIALANSRSDRDALVAAKLRAAGAILLGKNNLSEWSYGMTVGPSGFSALGGQVRNPYGKFDVAGSSSGSAVAVAANLTTVSAGGETSGSIIAPSSQNSVVGIKPSLGLVSRDRIIPLSDSLDSAGPIARNVTDAAILLTVIAGFDPSDPASIDAQKLDGIDFAHYLELDGLKGKRVGLVRLVQEIKPEDNQFLEKAGANLAQAGAIVVELPPINYKLANVDIGSALAYGTKFGVNDYLQEIGAAPPIQTLADVIAFNQQDKETRAPYGQALLEAAQNTTIDANGYAALTKRNRDASREFIDQLLDSEKLDFLVSINNSLSALYAPAGYPAISVPLGYRETGEPIGLTFVAKYLEDPQLISAAYAFEQATKLRKPPPLH